MKSEASTLSTRFRVGIFTVLGLLLIGAVTILVNDRPFWWRPCQLVNIQVEDATGLKMKSAVRSMGLQIGYLQSVQLSETYVSLGICITAPVEVLPSTRAFIRGEGFLGDKFVELKPVRYIGDGVKKSTANSSQIESTSGRLLAKLSREFRIIPSAMAADPTPAATPTAAAPATRTGQAAAQTGTGRQIPVGETSQDMQAVVNRVDSLVNEMTTLTTNLRQAINPEELRQTMRQLNRTLENASRTLSPDGGLNQTAQRTLAKLEDAIEQMRDMLTRVNQGQGSVGMLLNDPTYAEELKTAIKNINKLLGKANNIRFVVDIGGEKIRGYQSSRGFFKLQIWPNSERYYLLGISIDPRGRRTISTVETQAGALTTVTRTTTVEETGILLTGMFGKTFFDHRLDLSIGALFGDGAVSGKINLGPVGQEDRFQVRGDIYARGNGIPTDGRALILLRPWSSVYVTGGLESFREVDGLVAWSYGAGITFDDEDIKLLFTFR